MPNKFIYLLVFTLTFISCKQDNELTIQEYSDVINKELTRDLAFETTAFVEKYWRVVRNTGFNESIYRIAELLGKDGYVKEENTAKLVLKNIENVAINRLKKN